MANSRAESEGEQQRRAVSGRTTAAPVWPSEEDKDAHRPCQRVEQFRTAIIISRSVTSSQPDDRFQSDLFVTQTANHLRNDISAIKSTFNLVKRWNWDRNKQLRR